MPGQCIHVSSVDPPMFRRMQGVGGDDVDKYGNVFIAGTTTDTAVNICKDVSCRLPEQSRCENRLPLRDVSTGHC
jgi:hypothetical protein